MSIRRSAPSTSACSTGAASVQWGNPIGLTNFGQLLQNGSFWSAALHSAQLFLFIFVFQNTVSLGLALMLNRRSRMTHIYRAIIFLPVIMSAVATGVIWILMLDPIIGIVNPVLRDIGLGVWQREWQSDQTWAMRTVMLVQAWQWNGMAVVLYLAGLQNVPEDLKQAALVDGARRWQVFRDIVFPMLAPAFTVVTVLSFILIFRAFDLIYVLSGTARRAGRGDPRHRRADLRRCLWRRRLQLSDADELRHCRGSDPLPLPGRSGSASRLDARPP